MTLFYTTSAACSLLSMYNLLSVYLLAGLGGPGTVLTLINQYGMCAAGLRWDAEGRGCEKE